VKQPALVIEKNHSFYEKPILIVDRKGLIGDCLVEKLKEEALLVYVSDKNRYGDNLNHENIVNISFEKKIPVIPENDYSFIFVVNDNEIIKESLLSFVKKTEENKSNLILITKLSDVDDKIISFLERNYKNVKSIIYGELFSEEKILGSHSLVEKIILEAKSFGRIDVPQSGMQTIYPTEINELITNTLEISFGRNKEEKNFYLFSEYGITYLSIAHQIQKSNPWIKIDFKKKNKIKTVALPNIKGVFLNNDIKNKMTKIMITESSYLIKEKTNKKKEKRTGRNKTSVLWGLFFVFLLIFLPLLSSLTLAFIGIGTLALSKEELGKGNINKVKNYAFFANTAFSYSKYPLTTLETELSLINKTDLADQLWQDVETGENISRALVLLSNSLVSLENLSNISGSQQESVIASAISDAKTALVIIQKEKNKNNVVKELINKNEKTIDFISTTIDLFPEIAGFKSKKTYLILFQNNMELRAGGGFVGSYGLLTIDKGKIFDFSIYDVYDADGQLKVHVEPPFYIRRYLKNQHLFLRDSNYSVDFREVASMSAFMLNLEKNIKVDGVIGVDITFVKNILSALGTINVSDYNEKVNSENLFYLTESHAEKNFFPGSSQKKDFLKALFNSMVQNLTQKNNVPYFLLLEKIILSVEEKHLIFGFNNLAIQNVFTVNGWSSSLWDKRTISQNKINDHLGINESNFGANKVNYYVARSIDQKIEIDKKGKITEQLLLSFNNTSEDKWPGGDYKTYIRLILPSNSEIEKIYIDDKLQKTRAAIKDSAVYEKPGFIESKELELDEERKENKKIYGFFVNIPAGKMSKIKVNYVLNEKIDLAMPYINYDLRLYKQPGVENIPYNLLLTIPEDYKLINNDKEYKILENKILYDKVINKDKNIRINFTKK